MTGPASLSKSTEKATGCERYFAGRHLEGMPREAASSLAGTGTDFHAYRAAYVDHLVAVSLPADPDWVERWLETADVSDEAREMIERDAAAFQINPDIVFGTELFLSVDEEFRPLENEPNPEPGRGPKNAKAFLHGTLDHLEIDGPDAWIVDAKSGWSTQNVKEYEGAHYALLVFAHFPYVNTITFEWDFIRAGGRKPLVFERADLPSLQLRAKARHRYMRDIVRRWEAGEELAVNPQAGLCHFCTLTCPLREAVTRKIVAFPPIQNAEDAQKVAILTYLAKTTVRMGEELLKPYLNDNGPLDLGGGLTAEVKPGNTDSFSLRSTLSVLGFEGVPEKSPKWDISLESLLVSGTKLKSFAAAKKRAGLKEELDSIARRTPTSRLDIHKTETEEGAE
jgi:hypothetical protein